MNSSTTPRAHDTNPLATEVASLSHRERRYLDAFPIARRASCTLAPGSPLGPYDSPSLASSNGVTSLRRTTTSVLQPRDHREAFEHHERRIINNKTITERCASPHYTRSVRAPPATIPESCHPPPHSAREHHRPRRAQRCGHGSSQSAQRVAHKNQPSPIAVPRRATPSRLVRRTSRDWSLQSLIPTKSPPRVDLEVHQAARTLPSEVVNAPRSFRRA